jgi:short-subunit dehydrogenase
MSGRGAITIVGAGPGVGASVARRFGREGHPVGLIARDGRRLEALVNGLEAEGIEAAAATADARRPAGLRGAMDTLNERFGAPEVLCFSPLPDVATIKPVDVTTAEDLAAALELGVVGAAATVGHALAAMRERGSGTLLFTTGSAVLTPNPERATSGVANAAQATYIRMLHDRLAGDGIYVLHTVIVGPIGAGGHDPDDLAERMWKANLSRDEARIVIR